VQDYAIRVVLATHPNHAEATELVQALRAHRGVTARVQAVLSAPRIRALFAGSLSPRRSKTCAPRLCRAASSHPARFEGEAEGVDEDKILEEILKKLPSPKA